MPEMKCKACDLHFCGGEGNAVTESTYSGGADKAAKSGALVGMAVGTIVPGIGNIVGALVGAAAGGLLGAATNRTVTTIGYKCPKCGKVVLG